MQKGEFPPEVLQDIAAKYVESVQGTYDYRGLPAIAQKGTFAPYLSLARWNVEKLNNFQKYVIDPARNGNYTPLLMQTIGAIVGGAAVTKLVEEVTRRKEKTPKFEELAQLAKDENGKLTEAVMYKLAGLASLSGYAGFYGDIAKGAMDVWFKNRPQGYNNPLIGAIETTWQNGTDLVEALRNGDWNAIPDALGQFMMDTTQGYRIAATIISDDKLNDVEKQNKLRDLKLWKTTHGMPVSEYTNDRPNPFMDKDIKEFKKTQDLNEAAGMLPDLIKKAFDKAAGDPEALKRELTKLKINSYQTMPSFENMQPEFAKYLTWLQQTQGDEAATKTVQDYFTANALNKAKTEMIP